jgi:hypothetical protein
MENWERDMPMTLPPPIVTSFPYTGIIVDGETYINDPTFDGTAEADSTVTVYDGNTILGTAVVNSSGNWSFATSPLSDGTYSFTLISTDAAGNTSQAAALLSFTVDTQTPPAPIIHSCSLNQNGTFTLSGTTEQNGGMVAIYDGTLLGYAVSGSNGNWVFTTGELPAGTSQSFTAIDIDAAWNFSAPSAALNVAGAPATAPTELISDYAEYFSGPYSANNSVWGNSGLVNGVGYTQSITLNPETFPNNTTLSWSWPSTPAPGGVYAYPEIIYGSTPYQPNDGPGPTQLANFAGLSTSYSITLSSGNPNQYNAIFDLWFTSQPNGGHDTRKFELEIVAHADWTPPASNLAYTLTDSTLTNAGVYIIPGYTGDGDTWTNITVLPQSDMLSGTISISDIIKSLIWNGVVTGQEYLSGVAFGAEPTEGSGTLTINNLSYQWNGNPTVTLTAGNNTYSVVTPGGNDIVGNGGIDTIIYQGTYSQYQIKQSGTETLIQQSGNISTLDALNGIAFVQFSDGTYDVATSTFTSSASIGTASAPVISSFSPDSGTVGDGITNATTLTLVGTAAANSTVAVFDGTTQLGTATVNASGAWSLTTGTLANGTHSFTATDTDASGNTSVASSVLAVTVDTVAPAVSSVAASGSRITNGTGDLNVGHVVTLTVNLSEAVTVTGGTPTLTLNDGGAAIYTGGSGSNALTFSYTVAAGQNTSHLAVTAVNLNSATVTDAAGNAAVLTAAVTTLAGPLQIDTTVPTAPVISSDSPASGTAVDAVTLVGTAEANSTVTVYEGTSALGTVIANNSGAWSFTTGTLAAGSYTFTATATDAAGNVSAMSQPIDPTIGSNTYPTNNTTLTITDTNDTVILSGSNDIVNLTGSGDTIQLSGSNDVLTITGSGNTVNVTGSNDSVSSTGTDMVTFSGSGGNTVDATIGSGSTLKLGDELSGSGNDTLALTGNSGTVNLNQLAYFSGFSGVSLSGSADTLTLTNANLNITRLSGSGDTIKLGTGIDTVAYTNVNQSTHSSYDTISGFNAHQDKIDFSAISGLNSNAQHVTMNFLTSTPTSIAGHTIDVVTSWGRTVVYANATGSSESISANHEDMQINLTGLVAMNSSDFFLHH